MYTIWFKKATMGIIMHATPLIIHNNFYCFNVVQELLLITFYLRLELTYKELSKQYSSL